MFDNTSTYTFSFKTGVKPVQGRFDAPFSARRLNFSSDKKFLYVVDSANHRVLKYDYENQRYVGWIGGISRPNGGDSLVSLTGSQYSIYSQSPYNIADFPTNTDCQTRGDAVATPGWCLGGLSSAAFNGQWDGTYGSSYTADGAILSPNDVAIDSTYLYVVNSNQILRYKAGSGAFAGWIGMVQTNPTAAADGNSASCSVGYGNPTSGWCMGGRFFQTRTSNSDSWGKGDLSMRNAKAIATDGTYLYVGQNGAVLRIQASDGSFQGWIGQKYDTALFANSTPTGGESGCTSLANYAITPGWCMGGAYNFNGNIGSIRNGAIGSVNSLFVDVPNNKIYVGIPENGGSVNVYNLASGAFIQYLPSYINIGGPESLVLDSNANRFYAAAGSRILAFRQSDGLVEGWMGKVSNASSMFSALDNSNNCSNLSTFDNTPGWCTGGTWVNGADETSFLESYALADDGQGSILVGSIRTFAIRKFNKATGAYQGTMTLNTSSSDSWNNDATSLAQRSGISDQDFYEPLGSYNDGTYLYVADSHNSRVKKMKLSTGEVVGWIGPITTKPTGGATGCTSLNSMTVANMWCLGSVSNLWAWWDLNNSGAGIMAASGYQTLDGYMAQPTGITGDGTFLYITDRQMHRINKYRADNGNFVGWIGYVNVSPTDGDAGCAGRAANTFTPGWCKGGTSKSGSVDGALNNPSGIIHHSGSLYVVDTTNHRVSKYSASTGAFVGWIGRVSTTPTGGCTPVANGSGYNVSGTGWCTGGTSGMANGGANWQMSGIDRGGGFNFWLNDAVNGITTDGTYLYVSNLGNYRIDRFAMDGSWHSAVLTRFDAYNNTWSSDRAVVGAWNLSGRHWASDLTIDSNNIYIIVRDVNLASNQGWGSNHAIVRINKTSGNITGWQGGIYPNRSITGGDSSSCVGASNQTPTWCTGGLASKGYKLGQFDEPRGISSDQNFIYVSDFNTGRVTRLPK